MTKQYLALMLNKGCTLSPTLFGLYIDELETHLDKIHGISSCVINTVVIILLYVDDVVMLSKLWVDLQRFMNKLQEICTSSSYLEIHKSKIKITIFDCHKRKLKQKVIYLHKDEMEITHKYKYLGIDFYLHGYLKPLSRGDELHVWSLDGHFEGKKLVTGITCWELNPIYSRL